MLTFVDISSDETRAAGRRRIRVIRARANAGELDVTQLGDCFWHQWQDIVLSTEEMGQIASYMQQRKLNPPA